MHVLFVCTANRCRSPIAQAFFALRLGGSESAGGERPSSESAGLLPGGYPVPDEGVRRVEPYGLDLSGHLSTQVSPAAVARADLVMGMSRRHVRALIADYAAPRERIYTLKYFVRCAEQASSEAPGTDLPGLLSALNAARPVRSLLGRSGEDDITDPMGQPARVWDAVVSELDEYVSRLVRVLAPRHGRA